MKSYISVIKYVGSIALLMLLLMSCNKRNQNRVSPRYTDHPSPAKVTVDFPASSKLPDLECHIDNNKMRIYNKEYLPYQSKVDSAYLRMIVSTEVTVSLYNESTKKTVNYLPTDTGKFDLTGGKLKIIIEKEGEKTLEYDMRLLSYGYDPAQFTWKLMPEKLPAAAKEANVIEHNGKRYWVSKDASDQVGIYEIDLPTMKFTQTAGLSVPKDVILSSIMVDKLNVLWAVSKGGDLLRSADFKAWEKMGQADVRWTMLLSDVTGDKKESEITAVGYYAANPNKYFTFRIADSGDVIQEGSELVSTFPIRDAYVYSYRIGGVQHSYILGGLMADGKPSPTSFFTSDGIKWGVTPYSKGEQLTPSTGGLYLRSPRSNKIYVVGGIYMDNKPSNLIKESADRGITWNELTKSQAPGEKFMDRVNASGIVLEGNEAEFYIFGGVIDNKPSVEIWHGWLDVSAGIINSY